MHLDVLRHNGVVSIIVEKYIINSSKCMAKPFSVGSWSPGPGLVMITALVHFRYVLVIKSKLPTVHSYNGAPN